MGFCFGVRDAIRLAESAAAAGPVTILGALVHNDEILKRLNRLGAVSSSNETGRGPGAVMITAHGVSDRVRAAVVKTGRQVLDATCPLVRDAHEKLRQLVAAGCFPVVIGRRGHVEVNGLTGDFDEHAIVLDEVDLVGVPERSKYGVVAQTTQPIARVERLVAALRQARPQSEVHFVDTVCGPTKRRQEAAVEMAQSVDVVLVIGGGRSNNTHELAQSCRQFCARVHQIEGPLDLNPCWFEDVESVGLTAGTSTPEYQVDAVEAALRRMNPGESDAQSSPCGSESSPTRH